jgi:hypothetical protein
VSESVCVQLHGAGQKSISVFLPYSKQGREIRLGELFRTPGPPSVYPEVEDEQGSGGDKVS